MERERVVEREEECDEGQSAGNIMALHSAGDDVDLKHLRDQT